MVNDNKGDYNFQPDDYVVYPTHGVGRVVSIEENEIAGHRIELIVVSFEHEKMTLRVPTYKLKASGMRPLAKQDMVDAALDVLRGRARIKRAMWSRRAQEYESKINSGCLTLLAEVIRDLYKGANNNEQSYSERQLFEVAYDRLSREIAVVSGVPASDAGMMIDEHLNKKEAA